MKKLPPYGYTINEGEAVVIEEEAKKLQKFFDLYLHGWPTTKAVHLAEMPSKYKDADKIIRPEYCGTDLYPPIITEDLYQQLLKEKDMRKVKKSQEGPKNTDHRSRARIPYGYKIVDGKAEIDLEEVKILKTFFELFLEGATMSQAARFSGLDYSARNLPKMFGRKEYLGDGFYPAIITKDYQEALLKEREDRKGVLYDTRGSKAKSVRIFTEFYAPHPVSMDSFSDAGEYVTALYMGILPIT